jgi:hypothetical protein
VKYPVVEVVWTDHSFTFGNDKPHPVDVRSIGYLVKKKKRYVVLAQSLNPKPQETLLILRATLKSMRPR